MLYDEIDARFALDVDLPPYQKLLVNFKIVECMNQNLQHVGIHLQLGKKSQKFSKMFALLPNDVLSIVALYHKAMFRLRRHFRMFMLRNVEDKVDRILLLHLLRENREHTSNRRMLNRLLLRHPASKVLSVWRLWEKRVSVYLL